MELPQSRLFWPSCPLRKQASYCMGAETLWRSVEDLHLVQILLAFWSTWNSPVCPCSMRWSLWPRSIFSRVRSPTKFVQIRKYILREMYGCTKTTRINLSCGIHFSGKAWSPCPIEFLPVSISNTIDASNEEKPVKILALGKFVIN